MATYYIAPTGNDTTGDGSTGHPWATLTKFLASCSDGDTCKIRTGDYYERPTTAKNNLIIEPDTAAAPVFCGGELKAAGAWSLTAGKTVTYEAAFTTSVCYTVYNGSTRLTSRASIDLVEANANSYFFDNANDKLYVNVGGVPGDINAISINAQAITLTGSGCTVRGLTFKYHMKGPNLGGSGNTLDNCTLLYWAFFADVSAFSHVIVSGSGATVSECTITAIDVPGISLVTGASSALISSCQISGGTDGVLCEVGTGHVISQCTISGTTTAGVRLTGAAAAEIAHCTIYNCPVQIYHALAATGRLWAHHCLLYSTSYVADRTGVWLRVSNNDLLEYCTARDFWRDGYTLYPPTVVKYCVAENCGHVGFNAVNTGTFVFEHCIAYLSRAVTAGTTGAIYAFVAEGTDNTVTYTNCIAAYMNRSSLAGKEGFCQHNNATVTLRNCIAVECGNGIGEITETWTPTIDADYCLLYGNATNITGGVLGAHCLTTVAPQFKNSGIGVDDFRLLPSSPCIDAGVLVAGVNEGFRGGAPDIGAHEFVRPVRHGRR